MNSDEQLYSDAYYRLRDLFLAYPWRPVLLATALVFVIVLVGSAAVDLVWRINWLATGHPLAAEFRGTCYWMSDARILVRIAGQGYSDYNVNLQFRHLTQLPDRSWWPVFTWLTHLTLRLTGGNYCAGWIVNLVAMLLLVPVIQAITKTRRPLLMTGVALLPFGFWMYAGISDGTFLLVSGILLAIALRQPSTRWRVNVIWGLLALWNMMRFAALNVMAILLVQDLPPRWPSAGRPKRIPVYAAASILTVFGLMYNTGQAHAIERYLAGNIFYVIAFLRYV